MEGKMIINRIEGDLFGGVEKLKASGKHEIDLAQLLKPLESEGAVMRAFCRGCGTLAEIDESLARQYAKMAGVEMPENPAERYFESGGCALCDSADSWVRIIETV